MSRFGQVEMEPLYGISHYIIGVAHGMFFRGEIAGLENVPRTGAYLVAANHASHLDPPFIGGNIPRQMAFFARKTLWKPGLPSRWLDRVGAIPVDRDGGSDLKAIKRVLATLAEGKALVLFPEGTRSPDGELQPAKAGVGMIACKTGVPVVPVRIFNSHLAFGRGGGIAPGTPVHIVYGAPIPASVYDVPSDGKDRYQRASERIMARIAALTPPPVVVI
jgi:1-acyl-sn-glycerol-3-phosphate acyltransferase